MADQEPSMRVTLRDVYTIVMDLKSQLEKLNQNLPTTAQRLEEHEKETKEQQLNKPKLQNKQMNKKSTTIKF